MARMVKLLVVGLTLFANTTHAGPIELPGGDYIQLGDFPGVFAGHLVTFSFQQVFPNHAFNGVGVFTGGPHDGIQFGFTGYTTDSGGIYINRDVGIGTQTANDPSVEIVNDQYVWHGLTKGPGIPPEGLPFELSVPK